MLVEAFVLDRDDRLLHDRRDVGGTDEDPALGPAQRRENRVPVVCVDVPVHFAGHAGRIAVRNLSRHGSDQAEREGRDPEQ